MLMLKLALFDTLQNSNSQNSIISFDYSWFLDKNLYVRNPSLENSTTSIAIFIHEANLISLDVLATHILMYFESFLGKM